MPEKPQADIELERLFTQRGLRRIANDGYRDAFHYSPEGLNWYDGRGSTRDNRIKVPPALEQSAAFIAKYHPTSPSRVPIIAMDGMPEGPPSIPIPPQSFLRQVQHEVRLFICTNDQRYADVKRNIATQARKSQLLLISAISGAVGGRLGTEAGILTPLVALYLLAALKIGKEAYCRSGAGS
jgi:hypothetical protein